MNPILEKIILAIVPAAVTGLFGWLLGRLRGMNGMFKANFEATRFCLRQLIISDAKFYVERGSITPQEKAQLDEAWRVYNQLLKGNGEAEAYYKLAAALPVTPN